MFRRQSSVRTQEIPPSKYNNSTTVEQLIDDSRTDLGGINTEEPLRILKANWVDVMRDVRQVSFPSPFPILAVHKKITQAWSGVDVHHTPPYRL